MAGVMGTMGSYAEAGTTPFQAEETARLIAALLSTGRVVIDRNQTLIDDPNKGDKGFTPEVFERQVINEFRARTGVDLTKPTLPHLPSGTTTLLRAL
jgi:general secretion pathway protein A